MRFFEKRIQEISPDFRPEKWHKQGLMYLSCGFYFQTERWIDMPRMSKKRKQEWALFLNDRNRITYNELCKKCRNDCKQSFRGILMLCPKYLSKGRTKKNDWKWNNCQRTSWSFQGKWIEPKEVKWLWYPCIPFGKSTLLQGNPGDGKSKLILSIAVLLSKGKPLSFTQAEENDLILSSIRQRKMTQTIR